MAASQARLSIQPITRLQKMESSSEENLYLSVEREDHESLQHFLLQGADPNKVTSKGKTCLGEASRRGNIVIIKSLLDATNSPNHLKCQNISEPKRTFKRKLKHNDVPSETISKQKYSSDRSVLDHYDVACEDVTNEANPKEINQGYFVVNHNDGSSRDESKASTLNSSISSASLTPTSQGDLEWDEELTAVAPTTSDDEIWSSLFKWYASILESTGAALESAASITNGIDQEDNYTRTALHYAAENGHLSAVKLLLESGCKVDVQTSDGLTPLHVAVKNKHVEVTKTLLASGSQVNYETHNKMTPLLYAATRGPLEMIKVLVSYGACVEARDAEEMTPLALAADKGRRETVKFLISAGSNVNCEDGDGYTPLCWAAFNCFDNVVEELLASGARVIPSHLLLHRAILCGQEVIARILIGAGGGLNLADEVGDTPLILGVRMSHMNCLEILLKAGANVNACNSITGENALHEAVGSVENPAMFEDMLALLLRHKIDMNATALTGDAPLHRALLLKKDDAARLLIRYGADINSFDLNSRGLDNLTIASFRKSPSLAEMLIKAGHFTRISDPVSSPQKLTETVKYVNEMSAKPLSLSDLCRIQLRRKCSSNNLMASISSLPIPVCLKKYLSMEIV